ncbi:uncharacterized protein ASCRUDRAFT_17543, partial [Ascoidea rubescens DSM 1968]
NRRPHNRYEAKRQQIQSSLTTKARLKKQYFKLLEKEGLKVPERKKDVFSNNKSLNSGKEKTKGTKNMQQEKQREKLEQQQQQQKEKQHQRKARAETRRKNKKAVGKKTSRGQPLMAPRISCLLEKIE